MLSSYADSAACTCVVAHGCSPKWQHTCLLQVFIAKYRLKFLQLTDIFLASSLVPAYTIAAFAKRFARIALVTTPAGAMICIGFIHNLLRRHPACTCLLHQPHPAPPQLQPAQTLANASGEADADAGAQAQSSAEEVPVATGDVGVDVYDADADDPAESRAIESSLWELTALRRHYVPMV